MNKKHLNIFKRTTLAFLAAAMITPIGAYAGWGDDDDDKEYGGRMYGGKILHKLLDDVDLTDAQEEQVKDLSKAAWEKHCGDENMAGSNDGEVDLDPSRYMSSCYNGGRKGHGDEGRMKARENRNQSIMKVKELVLKDEISVDDLVNKERRASMMNNDRIEFLKSLHSILDAEQRKDVSENITDMTEKKWWKFWKNGSSKQEKMIEKISSEFSFTEEQKKIALSIVPSEEMKSFREIMGENLGVLAEEFKKDALDEAALMNIQTAMFDQMTTRHDTMAATMVELHSTLSTEQKQKIAEMIDKKAEKHGKPGWFNW